MNPICPLGYVGIVVYAYSTVGKTSLQDFFRSVMSARWSHWFSAARAVSLVRGLGFAAVRAAVGREGTNNLALS